MPTVINVVLDASYGVLSPENVGVLPLPVMVSASRTTITRDDGTFVELPSTDASFAWDFGDNNAESLFDPVNRRSISSNTASRSCTAMFVYRRAGVYTCRVTVSYFDPSSQSWASQSASTTITVVDPLTQPLLGWEAAYFDNNAASSDNSGTRLNPFTNVLRAVDFLNRKDRRTLYVAAGAALRYESEVQTVALTGSPTGGTFTLTFNGVTTSAIAHNANAATVQAALEALSSVGAGNAAVTGSSGGPWTIEFRVARPTLMTFAASLTGGTSPSVTVAAVKRELQIKDSHHVRVLSYSTNITTPPTIEGPGTSTTAALRVVSDATNDAASEVQRIDISPAAATGGTFTLTFNGATTPGIAYGASASTVQTAITALSTVGSGNIAVTSPSTDVYVFAFQNALASRCVTRIGINASGLTSAVAISDRAVHSTTTRGSPHHQETRDVFVSGFTVNANSRAGIAIGTGVSPGRCVNVYAGDGQIINAVDGAWQTGTTPSALSGLISSGIGTWKVGVIVPSSQTVPAYSLVASRFAGVYASTVTGDSGSETSDAIAFGVGTSTTYCNDGVVGFVSLASNRRRAGVLVDGNWTNVWVARSKVTGHRNGVRIGRQPANPSHRLPSRTVVEANDLSGIGCTGYSVSLGVNVGAATCTRIRNNVLANNGIANNAADADGADINIDDTSGTSAQNDSQRITITGSPTGGTFAISNGIFSFTVLFDASDLGTSLTAATGSSNYTLTGTNPYVVTFVGGWANRKMPLFRLTANSLTGGTSPSVTVEQIVDGAGDVLVERNSIYKNYTANEAPVLDVREARTVTARANAIRSDVAPASNLAPARSLVRFRVAPAFSPPRNESQVITLTGSPSGGFFTLTFNKQVTASPLGGEISSAIVFNATAAQVKAALLAAPSLGTNDVDVTGAAGGPWTVTFKGKYANTDMAAMTATNSLTGGSSPSLVITTPVAGTSGLSRFDGNVYFAPNMIRGGAVKPFALNDTTLVTFADWQTGNTPSGPILLDAAGVQADPEFRNPQTSDLRTQQGSITVDRLRETTTKYDITGAERLNFPDSGAFEAAQAAAGVPYGYRAASLPALPVAGAAVYRGGDIQHLQPAEAVQAAEDPALDIDNRPHRHLAARDNIVAASLSGVLLDINAAFSAPPQAGSSFTAPHPTIQSFIQQGHNPDGTLKLDGLDLSSLGYLRTDGQNSMLADLNMGFGTNRIVNLRFGTAVDHAMAVGQGVLKAGDTMTGPLVMQSSIDMTNQPINNVLTATLPHQAVRRDQAVMRAGDSITGTITFSGDALQTLNMGTHQIVAVRPGTSSGHAVVFEQVLLLTGGTLSGPLNMAGNTIDMGLGVLNNLGVSTLGHQGVRRDQAVIRTGGADGVMTGVLSFSGLGSATSIDLANSLIVNSGAASFSSTANIGTSTSVPQFRQTISSEFEDTKLANLRFKPPTWAGSPTYSNVAPDAASGRGINLQAVPDGQLATFDGRRVTGNVNDITQASGNSIFNVPVPTTGHQVANKKYVDERTNKFVKVFTPAERKMGFYGVGLNTAIPGTWFNATNLYYPGIPLLAPGNYVVIVHFTNRGASGDGGFHWFQITCVTAAGTYGAGVPQANYPDGQCGYTVALQVTVGADGVLNVAANATDIVVPGTTGDSDLFVMGVAGSSNFNQWAKPVIYSITAWQI